jgi:hypothetical protein
LRWFLRSKKTRRATKAITEMLPITIPAVGPPPNPLFEPLEAAVDNVEDAAEVDEAAVSGEEIMSGPPLLVVVLSKTDTL